MRPGRKALSVFCISDSNATPLECHPSRNRLTFVKRMISEKRPSSIKHDPF